MSSISGTCSRRALSSGATLTVTLLEAVPYGIHTAEVK